MHQKNEQEVTAKLSAQFNNEWTQKEAILKKKIAVEKAAQTAAGSSSKPHSLNPNKNDDAAAADDDSGTPHLEMVPNHSTVHM